MRVFFQHTLRKLLCFLLAFICLKATAQLHADFTANIQEGCSPLVVQFTDVSTGNPTSWFWDLGNGATSQQKNPGAIYVNPGTYTVKLHTTNSAGQDSITKTNYITVYENPSVSFTADPTEGCAPLDVRFIDNSTAGSGVIGQWIWDFGDGEVSNFQNPLHTYNIPDTFNVLLTVINSFGCKQSLQQKSLIKISASIKAGFNYTYSNVCNPPSTVTFTNTSQSNKKITYEWSFGDGSTSTIQDPVHVYNLPGNYTIQLIAISAGGCSDTSIQVISIGTTHADFDFTDACAGSPVLFTDNSTPAPINEIWDFGDGTKDSGSRVQHIYQTPGTYQVKLITDFGGCSDTIKKVIQTGVKPVASFTITGNRNTCTVPQTYLFTNTSQNAVSYKWIFGDGTISSVASPVHTYTKAGAYTVALIAFNATGCSDTVIMNNYIDIGPPKIQTIENVPFLGCAPQTITFKPVITSGALINSYKWDFGDSTTSTDSVPDHTYKNTGIYNVSLIVSTSEGCGDTMYFPNAVKLGTAPTAYFSAAPLEGCAETPIEFKDSSIGIVTDWIWYFGDGTASGMQNPTHVYTDTGYFNVMLVVSQYGCHDTLIIPNYIYIQPPVANFIYLVKCSDPFSYSFFDNSTEPKTWLWDFGDGVTSTKPNPVHKYQSTGHYTVSLTVTNGNCSYTKYDSSVNVVKEDPSFKYKFLSNNFCKYDSVQFTATNYNAQNILSFKWDFGDGTVTGLNQANSEVYHYYSEAGTFTPVLIVKDINGCLDTVNKNINVQVFGPNAAFSNKVGDCLFSTITFTDESNDDGLHKIKTWIWNYGDSTKPDTLTGPPFKHKYDTTGLFDVSLKVIDNNNCYDTITNISSLHITQPIADFSADSLSCTGSLIQFNDLSEGYSLSYNWDFGDGQSSTDLQPLHNYASEGTYDVKLTLIDKFGCADSILKPQYIRVANPVANFSVVDTIFACPPAKIDPFNSSLNYASLLWDFGDGNTSSDTMPEHYYISSGTYDLTLIVHGYGNCYDTLVRPIILKGPNAKLSYSPFTGCNPLNINFSAKAVNTVKYIWDFGNGFTIQSTDSVTNYTYLTPGKFLPQLVIEDTGGCRVAVVNPDTILVQGAEAGFFATRHTGTCDSSMYEFTDSSKGFFDNISSYNWKFGDGDSVFGNNPNPSHYYHQATTYNASLEVITQNGCKANFNLPVNALIDSTPNVIATMPDSACVNANSPFTAAVLNDVASNYTWQWNFGNGNNAFINDTSYAYSTAGTYNVSVIGTSLAGCANTVSKNILINPLPPVDAGIDSTICLGQSINLMAAGALSYTWLADATLSCINCNNPIAKPLANKNYYVTGTNSHGCIATDSVFIEVKQPPNVSINAPDTVCVGTTIQLKASGAELYSWQPASLVSNSTDSVVSSTPATTTSFLVVGTDSKQCFSDTVSKTVNVFPIPVIQVADSVITVSAGNEHQLNVFGSADVVSWSWMPLTNISCSNCPNPIIKPTDNITYTVTAKNIAGCSAQKHITVFVLCKDQNLFVPNTFSPNNDGMNDYFYPRSKGIFNVKSFRVFSRWGTVVYERTNFPPNQQTYGWDGTYNGKALQADVYVFIVEVVCDNGKVITLKGNVTLLR